VLGQAVVRVFGDALMMLATLTHEGQ